MRVFRRPWMCEELLESVGIDRYRSNSSPKGRYLQIIEIFSNSSSFCDLYVSDSQFCIRANLWLEVLESSWFENLSELKNIKGGYICVSRYRFDYCTKTNFFVLNIMECSYHGGECDIINVPKDINCVDGVERLLSSGFFRLELYEINALISFMIPTTVKRFKLTHNDSFIDMNDTNVSMCKIECENDKKQYTDIRKENKNNALNACSLNNLNELSQKKIHTSMMDEIFDMTLREIKFTMSQPTDSYNEFTFLDLDYEKIKQEVYDQLALFCSTRKYELPCIADLENLETEASNDFLTFSTLQRSVSQLGFIAKTSLNFVDADLVKAICDILLTDRHKALDIVADSYIPRLFSLKQRLCHLKLLFIKISMISEKNVGVYDLFKSLVRSPKIFRRSIEARDMSVDRSNNEPEKKSFNTSIDDYKAITVDKPTIIYKPIYTNSFTPRTKKYNLLLENKYKARALIKNSLDRPVLGVSFIKPHSENTYKSCFPIVEITPKLSPRKINKLANVKKAKHSETLSSSLDLDHKKSSQEDINMNSVMDIESGEGFISTLSSLPDDENEIRQNNETKLNQNTCHCFNDHKNNEKLTDIQQFVKDTMLDLSLLIIKDMKMRRPITQKKID